jgi:Peptidase inhibitor family I36
MLRAFAISTCLFTCLVGSASAQYRPYGGPQFYGCIVFEHANFGGAQLPVQANSSIGYFSGFWNDRISSLACAPGCVITTFEHANFGGRRQTWAGSVPFVGRGWNDRISSMAVECGR